ncbi:KTSC domain-containing protein [Kitasatospora camelliae]|uniref:KTSC domain-containing protein n=1 Tax=Kitasatospora camelliae TaxID=3156397 RepID=A0AAU8JVY5_9ACTN
MVRTPLESTCVRSAGYDTEARELEIEFTGGAVYRYLAVPAAVYGELLAADSHGRYLNARIKGVFAYRRL